MFPCMGARAWLHLLFPPHCRDFHPTREYYPLVTKQADFNVLSRQPRMDVFLSGRLLWGLTLYNERATQVYFTALEQLSPRHKHHINLQAAAFPASILSAQKSLLSCPSCLSETLKCVNPSIFDFCMCRHPNSRRLTAVRIPTFNKLSKRHWVICFVKSPFILHVCSRPDSITYLFNGHTLMH